jgi:hypothetical protein
MIKKTITYTDYNDQEQTEDFYFSLTKLELMEMELNYEGGLSTYISQLNQTTAGPEAYNLFRKIILEAYGKKSPDGRKFWKEDPDTGRKYAPEFVASPAMAELIFGFLKDGNDAAAFVRGLLPDKVVAEIQAEAPQERARREQAGKDAVAPVAEDVPAKVDTPLKKLEEYSRDELLALPQEDFDTLVGTDPTKMKKDYLVIAMQRKNQG